MVWKSSFRKRKVQKEAIHDSRVSIWGCTVRRGWRLERSTGWAESLAVFPPRWWSPGPVWCRLTSRNIKDCELVLNAGKVGESRQPLLVVLQRFWDRNQTIRWCWTRSTPAESLKPHLSVRFITFTWTVLPAHTVLYCNASVWSTARSKVPNEATFIQTEAGSDPSVSHNLLFNNSCFFP